MLPQILRSGLAWALRLPYRGGRGADCAYFATEYMHQILLMPEQVTRSLEAADMR